MVNIASSNASPLGGEIGGRGDDIILRLDEDGDLPAPRGLEDSDQ